MRKALIGAAKVSVALGALALVLAFLGIYLVPAFAVPGAGNGPIFSFNATSNTTFQYYPGSNYGFQINITNETGAYGSIGNITFELGRPVGTLTNYTNYTTIMVQNYTNLSFINFTQEQLGPAGTYNFTWYANDTAPAAGKWNNSQTVAFSVAQNNTPINITIYLNNVTSDITYPRGILPLNITAQTNITGTILNVYSNYTGGLALLYGGTGVTRVENSTNLRSLIFATYNITANLTAQNYSSIPNASLIFTLNSSTINFILNLTYVNSSGYVSSLNSLAAFSPQFLAQEVFTAPETGCGHANMTVNFTQTLGGVATIPVNNTCNYTVTVTMTDFVSPTDQIFNSTLIINNLNMTSGTGVPIYADIQLLPLGTYGKASPSLKSILGGFAFNDTNIRATSSYQNVTFAIARRGFMPDGLYKCANWNQSAVGENKQVCSNWASATTPATDFTNTTYLNKTITTQNFTFYGYSEPFYNLRPLVKAYGNASNITTINILNWGNQRARYYSWVPVMKFNLTSKQPYLPSSDAYADAMYYDVPFFANPSAIEMLSYNFTLNLSFDTSNFNRTVGISITPRAIRSGQTLLSGNETALMPAWSVQDTDAFQGASVTRTILRPTFNTLYYSYNGTNCGPYVTTTTVGPGGASSAVFFNFSLPAPCNYNVSYDYTNNEMNLTLPNVTNPVLSVLFALGGRPTTGQYSPVYLVNQTFLGGFIPGPGQTPPSPGSASSISFMVKVNNTLSNFTTTEGKDLLVHFLYPKNVTIWENSSLSTINISVNMGSSFQLWQLNDTINAAVAGATNATASADVASNAVWLMVANETHLWNTSVSPSGYNSSIPVGNFIVNRTFSCSNSTESFPGSPSSGKNITLCFQEFDFNLTSINSWLPGDAKSNVTLNLTATLNVSILNSLRVGSGAAGTSNQFNASISTASAGEIRLTETQLPGFNTANCGSDFSNCSKTIILDGQALNTSSYRTGSIIVNLGSGTHAVSISYTVPAAAAATTTTSGAGGSTSTMLIETIKNRITKTFTSISALTPRSIYESELKDTNTELREITITVKNPATNIKITVEKLEGKPASITQEVTAGKVYRYMNITKENLADNNIDKIKIMFKVNKTWLLANGFNASHVILKRFTTQWDKLNTTQTSQDSSYVYYSADSPGFSVFAIAVEKEAVAPAAQPEKPVCIENWSCTDWSACINGQQTRTCADANNCGTVANKPAESQACEFKKPVDLTVVYILIAIIILGGLVYFAGIRKKEKLPEKKK